MGTWRRSGEITAKTWTLVRTHPQLMRFATRATIVGALVAAAFLVPAAIVLAAFRTGPGVAVGVILAFGGSWLATFLALRYIAGLVWAADKLLKGQEATFEDGMRASAEHTASLGVWALITVSVGWLLNMVQGGGDDNNPVVTILRFVLASLLAAAWSLITFFVLPVMVLERATVGPAMKRSVSIIRDRWGEAVVGTFRIGVRIGLMFVLPGILAIVAGAGLAAGVGGAAGVTAGILCFLVGAGLIIVGLVRQTAARQVFGVALYHYAASGLVVGPFAEEELAGAMTVRKSRRR